MALLKQHSSSWQLILADLSLILFLMTAAALTSSKRLADRQPGDPEEATTLAQAQSLYRRGAGLPSLKKWLEEQPRDPRASLTIVAEYVAGREKAAWAQAREMADAASRFGVRSRVIIRQGERDDVYASLAYDQAQTP
jgi:hypothetical protein